jgi:flagellar biosynthesis/type III secretory pathway protein FliH
VVSGAAPEQASLRRAFTVWFNRVFFAAPGRKKELPELEELTEVRAMLAETVAEWREEWKRQGLQEGRKEGRKEGQTNILLKQIEFKFGELSLKDRQRVQAADSETLLKWGERILTAAKLDEVFNA